MPRKKQAHQEKTQKVTKQKRANRATLQNARQNGLRWGESYTSLLLGVVVVVVAVLFGVSIFRGQHHVQQTSSLATSPSATPTPTVGPTPGATYTDSGKTMYVVKSGDDLWSVAEQFYHDGYKWTVIADANNLTDPSSIFSGNELILPSIQKQEVASSETTLTQQAPNAPNAIAGSTYTVAANDSLWDIAVRAYGDGYKWIDIAQANHLTDPGLIFSGNVLTIPR